MNWLRNNLGWVILAIIGLVFVYSWTASFQTEPETVGLNRVISELQSENVESMVISDRSAELTLKSGDPIKADVGANTDWLQVLTDQQIPLNSDEPKILFENDQMSGVWLDILAALIPTILIIGFILFMMRQASNNSGAGGAFSFGRSKAKLFQQEGGEEDEDGKKKEKRKRTSFDDVAALEEAKEELQEVVSFLSNPKKFTDLGARIPKGVLLVGPPGTGKTLLARAVAGEAGVPFYSISGSEFVEMFVGVGASRVRDLFEQAKKNAPCIVFVDELDAVGRHRGAGVGGGHDEREQTLNQILVEMDGFDPNTSVIVMAATNRPDVLDPALLRPGRFDRQVLVDLADVKGRESILRIHARGKPVAEEVDLNVVAKQTPGFSGADLENLMNEAAILTARRNKTQITTDEIDEAVDRVIAGPERRSKIVSDKQKNLTAYHEAGHAIVARMLPYADSVHKISIVARGMAGGYTRFLPEEDRGNWSREEFRDMIAALLGGRAAEEIVLGDITTGASDDLKRATSIARKMVTVYGMSEKLGPQTYGSQKQEIFLGKDIAEHRDYSEHVAVQIDDEVREIIGIAYQRAKDILVAQREILTKVAEELLEKEVLDDKEFESLFDDEPPKKPESLPVAEKKAASSKAKKSS